jgi:hypothetical protein
MTYSCAAISHSPPVFHSFFENTPAFGCEEGSFVATPSRASFFETKRPVLFIIYGVFDSLIHRTAIDFVETKLIHRLEIQDSFYSRFMRESVNPIKVLRRYRLHLGMVWATSWDGFGYVLGWFGLQVGMA